MNSLKSILTFSIVLVTFCGFSQSKTQKQIEREQTKVNIFTSEEKDNLQRMYSEEVDKMKLSEEKRDEYYSTLVYYTHSMGRLDDKDKDYTETEILEKFNNLQASMNFDMRALLTPEQYVIHLETFSRIIYSVNTRKERLKIKKQ